MVAYTSPTNVVARFELDVNIAIFGCTPNGLPPYALLGAVNTVSVYGAAPDHRQGLACPE
jgi:hypothetical protein